MRFVTCYAEGAAVGKGLRDGGMEITAKPFVVEALAARVRGIIDG